MASIARINGRFAHKSMHASLSAQPAVRVVAPNMDRRALDSGDLTRRRFDDFGFEPVRFRPTKVHTENHFGPVLRFSTAGAGLNIDIRVVGIHLTREHPPKFKRRKTFLEIVKIADDLRDGIAVVLLLGERQ